VGDIPGCSARSLTIVSCAVMASGLSRGTSTGSVPISGTSMPLARRPNHSSDASTSEPPARYRDPSSEGSSVATNRVGVMQPMSTVSVIGLPSSPTTSIRSSKTPARVHRTMNVSGAKSFVIVRPAFAVALGGWIEYTSVNGP